MRSFVVHFVPALRAVLVGFVRLALPRYENWDAWAPGKGVPVAYGKPGGGYYPMYQPYWEPVGKAAAGKPSG